MPAKTPATVITGFLGAGKTTLIRNLLAQANGKRIALIVNEFGDIGVDGDVLKGCGDAACKDEDIVELSNGCICCTVADDFVPTMETLLNRADPPDHIVIETSGLALPQPLVRAFNWPEIRTKVTVDGVVTVVDGPATAAGQFAHDLDALEAQRAADGELDHETPLSELFEDQLACADMVVVSKTDVMEGGEVDAVLSGLAEQSRDGVQLVRSSSEGVAPDVLLGLGIGAEDDLTSRHEVHHHHHHDHDDHHDHDHDRDHDHDHDHDHGHNHHAHEHEHGHDQFESFALTLGEVADGPAFAEHLAEVIRTHGILRLKGFVAVQSKPMRMVVQAVGPRIDTYFDRPFGTETHETRLVVIGLNGLDQAAIRKAIGG
ncbi:MAG: cobalamin biosynthesis protein CobW [Pseudomonadota bacterium]